MNKKIATEVALGIILIIAIVVGGAVWFSGNQKAQAPTQAVKTTQPAPQTAATDETAGWKIYTNPKYKFEFRYPSEWINQGRFIEDINFFKKSVDDDTLGVLQIELEKKYKDSGSLESIASQLIAENNCIAYGEKSSPDHIIKKSESGVMLASFCRAGSEYYEYLFRNENNDLIKLSYHDDFDFNLAEAQKIEKFEKIISTIKLTGVDETAGWQTYRNERHGFEMKYPGSWIFSVNGENSPEFMDIHIENINSGDGPGCKEKFSGLEIQVGITKDSNINFTEFVRNEAENKGNGLGQPNGKIEFVILNNINLFKVENSGWEGCGGPGYFIEQSKDKYTYVFTGHGSGSKDKDIIEQILSTFKFIDSGETAGWQTYRNEKYGFEFQYPKELQFSGAETTSPGDILYSVAANYSKEGDNFFNFTISDRTKSEEKINEEILLGKNMHIKKEITIPAGKIILTDNIGSANYYFADAYFKGDNYIYKFELSRPNYSKEMLDMFEKIVATGKFIK